MKANVKEEAVSEDDMDSEFDFDPDVPLIEVQVRFTHTLTNAIISPSIKRITTS
jgi:hypothetical protein